MPRPAHVRGAQVNQQLGAREVHVRDIAHEQDDQARRIGSLGHDRRTGIAHVIDVEIQERALRPDDEHVRLALVLGMARRSAKYDVPGTRATSATRGREARRR